MLKLQNRRFVRFAVDWRAAVLFPTAGRERAVPARAVDVSKEGLALTLEQRLEPGAVHRVAMAIPPYDQSGPRVVTGKYRVMECFVASDGIFRVGAECVAMDVPNEQVLMWFLREEARRLEWAYSRTTGKFEFVKEAY